MSALLDRYKFTLVWNGEERQVYPEQDDAVTTFDREDESQVFLRERIENDIILTKSDFTWLYAVEQGAERCLPMQLVIELITSGDPDVFTGNVNLDNSFFEPDFCRVTLKVDSVDKYSELYKIWEKPVNILAGTTKVNFYANFVEIDTPLTEWITFGTTETVNVGTFGFYTFLNPDFPNTANGWRMIADTVTFQDASPGPGPDQVTRKTEWVQELTLVATADAPPGAAWLSISAGGGLYYWARNHTAIFQKLLSTDETHPYGTGIGAGFYRTYTHKYLIYGYEYGNTDNAVTLQVALEKILSGTTLTVKSNLFGINPAGASPDSAPYTSPLVHELVISEITDIKIPDADENATILEMSLKQILDRLYNKFQAVFIVEGDTLIIEHQSFFEGDNGLDFTATHPAALVGFGSYRYKKDIPAKEVWYDAEGPDFQFLITYEIPENPDWADYQNCITEFKAPKSYVAEQTFTRMMHIAANPADYPDDGMVLIDTFIHEGQRMVYGASNTLIDSPKKLFSTYWKHRRFAPYAYEPELENIIFNVTWKPYKAQVPVTFKIPSLAQAGFNYLERQKTQLGWGEIESAKYSRKTGGLTLNLLHQ
jgi:hypothetical protein